jgi:uncharacterized protein (DUF2384 family)
MSRTLDRSLRKDVLNQEINEIIPDADDWRLTPNNQLGGKTPGELIDGTDEEREELRNLLEAIKHGMVS